MYNFWNQSTCKIHCNQLHFPSRYFFSIWNSYRFPWNAISYDGKVCVRISVGHDSRNPEKSKRHQQHKQFSFAGQKERFLSYRSFSSIKITYVPWTLTFFRLYDLHKNKSHFCTLELDWVGLGRKVWRKNGIFSILNVSHSTITMITDISFYCRTICELLIYLTWFLRKMEAQEWENLKK